jgi:hypothetical protein
MTTSALHSFAPVQTNRLRLVSGGAVLLLHVLIAIALLLHYGATRIAAPSRSMTLIKLTPEAQPVAVPKPVAPSRAITPPVSTLTSPVFTVAPREPRGITLPRAEVPTGAGASPSAQAPVKPGELFSEEKKKQFKEFFKQQAAEDARENAKAGAGHACDLFRAQKDPKMPDMQTTPNGIAKTFIPAIGFSTSGGEDGKGGALNSCD